MSDALGSLTQSIAHMRSIATTVADYRELPFSIGGLDSRLNGVGLRARALHEVASRVPATRGVPKAPRDLSKHSVISVTGVSEIDVGAFWQDGDESAVRFSSRFSVTTIDGAVDAGLAGAGLVRTMSYHVSDHIRDLRLTDVLNAYEPPLPVQLV